MSSSHLVIILFPRSFTKFKSKIKVEPNFVCTVEFCKFSLTHFNALKSFILDPRDEYEWIIYLLYGYVIYFVLNVVELSRLDQNILMHKLDLILPSFGDLVNSPMKD